MEVATKQSQPLQKLTEFQQLMSKKKITREDTDSMSKEERKRFQDFVNQHIRTLEGQAVDNFMEKIEDTLSDKNKYQLKNQLWEHNHASIRRAISKFICENGRAPLKNEIAEETKLSRQTIAKHLKEFSSSEEYEELQNEFKLLNHQVLGQVYRYAIDGNIKAARLFFEMTGSLGQAKAKNVFIMINNIRVDENMIKKLPQEAVIAIEAIITKNITLESPMSLQISGG